MNDRTYRSFEEFQHDLCCFHWERLQGEIVRRYRVLDEEAHDLLRSRLIVLQQRWDTLRDDPFDVLRTMVHFSMLEKCITKHHSIHYQDPCGASAA